MDRRRKDRRPKFLVEASASGAWTEADAQRILAAWRESEQSLAAFCRRYSLNYYRVLRWRKRLSSGPESPRTFYPVQVVSATGPSRHDDRITVVLSGGRRVAVAAGFDPGTLRGVVEALEQC